MFEVRPIGWVQSVLEDREAAPRQGDEGAPDAWIVFEPQIIEGLGGLRIGADILVLTWLDRADRHVLAVHPRDDVKRPKQGVFATRSADRPNPVGLHRVRVLDLAGERMRVSNLEALNGTPVIDIKPVLGTLNER